MTITHFPKTTAAAAHFGATHTIDSSSKGVETQGLASLQTKINAIVGSQGADIVIDTTGNTKIIEQCYDLTHPDGKTILVGVPKKGNLVSLYTLPLHFKKILKGSHGGSSYPTDDIPRLIRLCGAGKLQLDGLITHSFPLKHINEAIQLVRSGNAGRVAISLTPG